MGQHLVRLPRVDSTNSYVMEHASNLPNFAVVMADEQTGGKGRRGRSWAGGEPGRGLFMTVLLKDVGSQGLSCLPLVTALGVEAGLSGLCGLRFGIKWSNDILLNRQKVCGILCESRICSRTATVAVGVGVNVTQTGAELKSLGLVYATSVFLDTNKRFSPKEVAGAICNELESAYFRFFEDGFRPLRELYRQRCVTLGKKVRVSQNGREYEGFALDIAEDGSLLCEIGGEITAIRAGEASVRGMMGYSD